MEWKAWELDKQLAAGVPPLVLVYGDDHGAVQQAAAKVVTASGVVVDDPFMSEVVDVATLQDQPGRLLEAATTMGFGGGTRLVRVSGAGSGMGATGSAALTKALTACLEADLQEACIVVAASGIEAKSALAKQVSKHPQAVAVRCYAAKARDVAGAVRSALGAAGKRCTPEAQQLLQENLGQDAAVTQLELDKLITYLGEREQVTATDALAVLASAPSRHVFALCDAVAERQTAQADKLLHLLLEEGEDPYRLATMVHRHLQRLHIAQQGGVLKPPVPPFQKQQFQAQMQGYPAKRLGQLAPKYLELQLQLRGGVVPPDLAVSRWVLGWAA